MHARTTGKDLEPRGGSEVWLRGRFGVGVGIGVGVGVGNERERASATRANVKCTENDSESSSYNVDSVQQRAVAAPRKYVSIRASRGAGSSVHQRVDVHAAHGALHRRG